MKNGERLQVIKERHRSPINSFVDGNDIDWLIEQVERMEMLYENTGSIMNRRHQLDKIERYEEALKEIANPDASKYLSWQEDMTEQGNDLNDWDWFASIAKIALETKLKID